MPLTWKEGDASKSLLVRELFSACFLFLEILEMSMEWAASSGRLRKQTRFRCEVATDCEVPPGCLAWDAAIITQAPAPPNGLGRQHGPWKSGQYWVQAGGLVPTSYSDWEPQGHTHCRAYPIGQGKAFCSFFAASNQHLFKHALGRINSTLISEEREQI